MEVAQYNGGYNQYMRRITSVLWGDNISTVENNIGTVEDNISTVEGLQYCGGIASLLWE